MTDRYEEELGTDWESLSEEELYERAFALGVAASLGDTPDGEFDRLLGQAGSTYDRSIVELSYEEGRNRARKRSTGADDGNDPWTDLVAEGDGSIESVPVREAPSHDGVPGAVSRMELLDRPGDGLDRIRLPRFLLRR